jgi:arylsulfatase A
MRIQILLLFFLASCSKCDKSVSQSLSSNAISVKPNIILVLVDDVGYEVPGYTGGQSYTTPNIDALAYTGKQFVNCYSLPLCSPSRIELLTGKYNFRNYEHWGKLDTSNITIANVLKQAGYETCIAGKWQLDGGHDAITAFGFDNYSVWMPFASDNSNETGGGSHYKNPKIYQGGDFLDTSLTNGKYGEDIFRQYLFDFIDSTEGPKFALWAMNLCHKPFSPTPDDSVFATWNGGDNPIYFPSMVKYMDKQIRMLKDKVADMPNTIIIFIADNGTPIDIYSNYNGVLTQGGKGQYTASGTHVPMIIWGRGVGIDSSLVDFTDFYTTIASLAGATYANFDGIDFLNSERPWIFQHYQFEGIDDPKKRYARWVQDAKHKLYDTVSASVIAKPDRRGKFYKIKTDELEKNPITPTTINEKKADTLFRQVLTDMHN